MKETTITFSKKHLVEDIKKEGKILNLHMGSVEVIADKVAEQVEKWLKNRPVITKESLDKKVAKELEKYNSDLAYIYKNRGRII